MEQRRSITISRMVGVCLAAIMVACMSAVMIALTIYTVRVLV